MGYRIGAAIAVALSFCANAAMPQDVELRSLDETVALEGNLISYDGAFYRIDTEYGALTVAADGVSCAGSGCPDLATFVAEARIAGAATITQGLLPALLQAFSESRGMDLSVEEDGDASIYVLGRADGSAAARFIVTPGSTDDGFLALLNGDADIALALRAPSPAEIRAAETTNPDDPSLDDRVRVLALDALVPIVSPENPPDALSLPQIAQLFSGEVDNWQAMGGPNAPVALHLLEPDLGLAQAFSAQVLLPSGTELSPSITRHSTTSALAEAVAQDTYAIGITSLSGIGQGRTLPLNGPCGLSQSATIDAVKAEDYPLTAPVYMYLGPRRLPLLVRQFLEFAETDEAEHRIREAGFVDQLLTRTPMALQGERLASAIRSSGRDVPLRDLQEMIIALGTAERLSTTLRFNHGGAALDIQSRASIARLAAAVERGTFDGRQLMFVGFSDGNGSAEVNARLSLRRAEAVRDAFVAVSGPSARDQVNMITHGFGEAMPMACDDTDWGRAVNRRVEVWLN